MMKPIASDVSILQKAYREYLVQNGPAGHVLVSLSFATRLKTELNCSWEQVNKKIGIGCLAVVDELDEEFIIL